MDTFRLDAVIFVVFRCVVVEFVFVMFTLAILGTVTLVIVVFPRLVIPVTERAPVLRLVD